MTDALTRAAIEAHQEWIGFVQPVGLVVAPSTLVGRGVILDRNARPRQEAFAALLDREEQRLLEPAALFTGFLGWQEDDLAAPDPAHVLRLPEVGVTLEPNFAVPDPDGGTQLLVRMEADGTDLDAALPESVDGWSAPPQARFERLLRGTGIATGLLVTPGAVRLVHAPKGETSGHVTFPVAYMATVMGRPILAALDLLLGEHRLFRADAKDRLGALLAASREAQNTVSTKLSGQVLAALHELLRGFVAADARDPEHRFAELCRSDPPQVYGGLVTTLMRLVFVLYAEDRGLMPADPAYENSYGLRGLFRRLQDDAARVGDLMGRRFGAWPQLLALSRLIHRGGGHGPFRFTARKGRLFDPEAYPFLEGRAAGEPVTAVPMLPDGTVWRVLEDLLVLDGERLSYRTLDVEQIGSVYQVVMGFAVEVAAGRSLALRSKGKSGAAVVVDLEALAGTAPDKRQKALADREVAKLTDREAKALKAARGVPELAAALAGKVDRAATPGVVPAGTPVLQPTDERRRSGSHYTPRSLTAPIVAETLRPILERLGPRAAPEQVLDLKVLDPAMGSAAFLVEACRQLAEALVRAWDVHGSAPALPPDVDALLHARRLVAQRCLYGVDRNAFAAELGKLSLWLATLARDHEFTFLDHCIRHGDSLVGLDRAQLEALHWKPDADTRQSSLAAELVASRLAAIEAERNRIRAALDGDGEETLRPILARALRQLDDPKLIGDAVVAVFFADERKRALSAVRQGIEVGGVDWRDGLQPAVRALRDAEKTVAPFHWWLEFPEVFDRPNPGFDAVVGNPPFAGKNNVIGANRDGYLDWLKTLHQGAHGNADLVAHFFRRAYGLLRRGGCLGLIATNTIRQGDTRSTGLRPIREAGGTIYTAVRRYKWPDPSAAVVVCVIHIHKGALPGPFKLDGREVPVITAYLFHAGTDGDPARLRSNENRSFQGSIVLGMGFTFDDMDTKDAANPLSLMRELNAKDPRNAKRIFPYIGGEEVNDSPMHTHHRWVIDFGEMNESQARQWPSLMSILEERVRPTRITDKREAYRRYWWRHAERRGGLDAATRSLTHVLVQNCGATPHLALAFLPRGWVYANTLAVIAHSTHAAFCALQSRPHELWARFFGSSMKDDLRYTPSDCFETFPFTPDFTADPRLDTAGKTYYRFRAELMVQNNEGLTKTYNRFHDPAERSNAVHELRRLHEAMDRAVLDAYGWTDIPTACGFEPEWEDEEEAGSRRKKPYRYRWPEAVRDEVLARLLALNKERAEQERLTMGDQARRRRVRVAT